MIAISNTLLLNIWNAATEGFAGGVSVFKNPPANAGRCKRCGFDPWRRAQQPTPVFLPGESHGQRSLAGYGP